MSPQHLEYGPNSLLLKESSRRLFLRNLGVAAVGVPATMAVVADQLMSIDILATQLMIENRNIPPSITEYSDSRDALGFYVSFSGTGLPIAHYMSRMIASDVSKYNLYAMAVNDGSHIRIPDVASGLVARARKLRPDMDKAKFVFHGLSFGGIEAQLVANHIVEHYSDVAEVVGILYESTPSGPEAVKKLLGQYVVRTGRPVGKGMIYMSNTWGIMGEQGRRDAEVLYDIAKCSDDTFASVIPDQARLINAGFPRPVQGENSTKWYIAAFDDSDLYVNTDLSFAKIDPLVGNTLHRADLPGAGHAGGWTAKQYSNYFANGYEHAFSDIVPRLVA